MAIPKTILITALLGASLLTATGHATPIMLDSDAAFNALDFDKLVGANVRWGDSAGNATWEVSVVDGNDAPLDQQQFEWTTGSDDNGHTLGATIDQDSFWFRVAQQTGSGVAVAISEGDMPAGNPNALFFRVRSDDDSDRFASLRGLNLSFWDDAGTTILDTLVLGDLLGSAGDVQYLGLIDDRLSGLFTIGGLGFLEAPDGSQGSLPAYQIKLGILDGVPGSEIPLPGTLLLLGGGLLGLGLRQRR